jgi:hypothetical protein
LSFKQPWRLFSTLEPPSSKNYREAYSKRPSGGTELKFAEEEGHDGRVAEGVVVTAEGGEGTAKT